MSIGLSVGLLTASVSGQVGPGGGDTHTVVVEEGIDTTLAAFGLNGPDASHGAEGTNPDGVERWEWDGADCAQKCSVGGGQNQGLLWFDIPQGVLSSFGDGQATLALHLDDAGNAAEMYRMTSDWLSGPDGGDQVTFNNISGGPGVVPGQNTEADSTVTFPETFSFPALYGTVLELDVSADVKAWAAGSPNYGWGFVPVGGNGAGITSFEHASNPVPALTLTFSGGGPFGPTGDFNGDFVLDVADIDLLTSEIVAETPNSSFDVTRDGVVDDADLSAWLFDAAEHNGFSEAYLVGDSNLDGSVNASDLNNLALSWRQDVALWSAGDFTSDGRVDAADLNALALKWRQSIPMASAVSAPVPEPSAWLLALFGLPLVWRRRKRS